MSDAVPLKLHEGKRPPYSTWKALRFWLCKRKPTVSHPNNNINQSKSQQKLSNADQLRSGSQLRSLMTSASECNSEESNESPEIQITAQIHIFRSLYSLTVSVLACADPMYLCVAQPHKASHTELHRSGFSNKLIDSYQWHRGRERKGDFGGRWFHTEPSPTLLISSDL